MIPEGFEERMNNTVIVIGNNVYLMNDRGGIPEFPEPEEESLADRIKMAIEDYGCVFLDRETADKFFHAEWEDFVNAIGELRSKGYIVKSFIEKEN